MNRQTLSHLLYITGVFSCIFAVAMMVPCMVDWSLGLPHTNSFLISIVFSGVLGGFLLTANRPNAAISFRVREAFLLTTTIWVVLIFLSALPLYLSQTTTTFVDSLFEATSALTTTGSTVIDSLKRISPGLMLWRCLLQWFGGVGIIVMALTILPMLRVGGMQLYRNEFSDKSEKILPRLSHVTGNLLGVYSVLTVVCVMCYWTAGMPLFDAICHSFTTISTGGLSVRDESLAYYHNPAIEVVAIFFMVIGGSTLMLYVKALRGEFKVFTNDVQLRTYLKVMLFSTIILTIVRLQNETKPYEDILRTTCFQVVSIMTSTGLTTDDYSLWSQMAQLGIFLLMFVGGCTGSTSGGIKIFRFQVIWAFTKNHLQQLISPRGVFIAKYNQQVLDYAILMSVFVFLVIFFCTLIALTLIASFCGLDLETAFSGAVASITNVGPGFGSEIGPQGTYANLPVGTKLTFAFGMLMGRLEFLTLVILMFPAYWKEGIQKSPLA